MNQQINKYRINEYLYSLNIRQYRKAIELLPRLLGISLNTLHNYRKIQISDIQDIPYEKVVMMEMLFDFTPGTLTNKIPEIKSLKEQF